LFLTKIVLIKNWEKISGLSEKLQKTDTERSKLEIRAKDVSFLFFFIKTKISTAKQLILKQNFIEAKMSFITKKKFN
jgi:hypothetical protein